MASSSASVTFGSTVPLGLGNVGSLQEAVANVEILYHKALQDWITQNSVMKMFYQLRYEGAGAGELFTVSESITGSGVAHEIDENADPYIGDISPGYSKNLTVQEKSYSLSLTWRFIYGCKYPEQITNIVRADAEALAKRMEYDMAAPFTYCTSTAVTNIDGRSVDVSSGDGLSLANASHTVRNSSTTYRNRVATDPQISRGAIQLAQNLFQQQMIDNNGQRVIITPDTIVTCSDQTTYDTAMQLMKSSAPLDAPNASVYNPQMGIYRVVRAWAIDSTFSVGGKGFTFDSTKSKQWMLVDSKNSGLYLVVTLYPTVDAPTESNGGVDFMTRQRTWNGHTLYCDPAVVDPRFCVVSVVTSS